MQDKTICEETAYVSPDAEDAAIQGAVLAEIFSLNTSLTQDELIRHFAAFNTSRDSVDRAVRELVAAGVLNKTADEYVLPTRAARKFAELTEYP
jgi:predicted transcriptional regulator